MNPVFSLSKSNKIFGIVAAFLFAGIFLLTSEPGSVDIARALGRLLALLLIPTILSWIVWRFSGRTENSGSVAFNVLLALFILGQLVSLSQFRAQAFQTAEMENEAADYRRRIATAGTPEEARQLQEAYTESTLSNLRRLAAQSSGKQREFHLIMAQFIEDTQVREKQWNSTFFQAESERILDSSVLNSPQEFEFQRGVIDRYLEETRDYSKYFFAMPADLRTRLDVLGRGNHAAAEAFGAFQGSHRAQVESYTRLLKAHIRYGATTRQMLDFLEKNTDSWNHENGSLQFHSDDLRKEYDKLHESREALGLTINEISQQLLR